MLRPALRRGPGRGHHLVPGHVAAGEVGQQGPTSRCRRPPTGPARRGSSAPLVALDLTGRRRDAGAVLRRSADLVLRPGRAAPGRVPSGAGVTDATLVPSGPSTASAPPPSPAGTPRPQRAAGVAVIGVVAYHLQFGWASGGYLGVDLFFVLSGFLITTLLLEEWVGSGRINLAAFWGRRARRLLPALFLVVAALALYLDLQCPLRRARGQRLIDLSGLAGRCHLDAALRDNWHRSSPTSPTSPSSPRRRRCSTPGRWRSRSSSIWSGRWCSAPPALGRRGWRQVGVMVTVVLGVGSRPDGGAVPPGRGPDAGLLRDRHPPLRPHGRRHGGLPRRVARPSRARGRADPPRSARGRGGARRVLGPRRARRAACPRTSCSRAGSCSAPCWPRWSWPTPGWSSPGGSPARLAWRPLHFIGTISYGIYLWHWPVIVYLNGARTGLSTWPLDLLRIVVTLLVSTASYYLVERPIRLANSAAAPAVGRTAGRCGHRGGDRRRHHAGRGRSRPGGRHHASRLLGPVQTVPGAGGYAGQQPIRLRRAVAGRPAPRDGPGDSVMHDASYGITASLQATGEAAVLHQHHRRVRADDGDQLAHLHPQPDPPDPGPAHRGLVELGPVRADDAQRAAPAGAVHQPAPPGRVAPCSRRATAWRGSSSPQFPRRATSPRPTRPIRRATTGARAGVESLEQHRGEDAADFPGRVMYFPLADSVLLDGRYSTWLPPEGEPHAPSGQWIRVRKLDNVHLCPEGSARYAAACWRT